MIEEIQSKDIKKINYDSSKAHKKYGLDKSEWLQPRYSADVIVIDGIVYKDRFNCSRGKQSACMPTKYIICAETEHGYKRIYKNF